MFLVCKNTLRLVTLGVLLIRTPHLFADYVISDLGTPPGALGSFANGVNESGEAVGVGIYRGEPHSPPYGYSGAVWQNGTAVTVGYYAVAINDSGQVVGRSSGQAFVWQNGSFTFLPGDNGTAAAVSASGQVVGTILPEGPIGPGGHAILWQNGRMTDLGLGFANGINASGKIVGGSQTGDIILGTDRVVGSSFSHAVLWQNGTMTDLGPGYANAINASGQIVGTSNGQAVLWQNGIKTILGPGIANAINDLGQVVGGGTNPDPFFGSEAFLWQNGTMVDLNKLIPANSGWTLIDATGINDAGQIVGDGIYEGFYHAFLLTPTQSPVPEPATILLMVCAALVGLIRWIMRRNRLPVS